MDSTLTAGKSAIVSLATLIPSGVFAVVNEQTAPVIAGIAIGTFTGIWAIFSAWNDAAMRRMEKRLKEAEDRADAYRVLLNKSEEENTRVNVRNADLSEQINIMEHPDGLSDKSS